MTSAGRCVGGFGLALVLGLGFAARAMAQAPEAKTAAAPGEDPKKLTFSRDIAPVIVANCLKCHAPGGRAVRKFDQSTFQKLRAGGASGPVIVPGKPEESEYVLRIKGESDGPKMPPGDRDLAPATIAQIEEWIRAGARLDPGPGHAADAPLTSYALTPEARKREELARLTPEQRTQRLTDVARERWKKGSPSTAPEATASDHFLLFGLLPKGRAEATLQRLEGQYQALRGLLGPPGSAALNGPEKISIYVFSELTPYVEFVRGHEGREAERGSEAHANFGDEVPYLAAADPLRGGEDPAADRPVSKAARKKQEGRGGPERTLAGLLAEQMGIAATAQAGQPPRWLSLGLGAFLGSRLEPGSPYYRRLRRVTYEQLMAGWLTRAQEALGDRADEGTTRALGFSLVEWLASAWGPRFPPFARGMLGGPEKLDEGIRALFGANREQFLTAWGTWIQPRYRQVR
jgi:mono/diheme cytochrome c family protein